PVGIHRLQLLHRDLVVPAHGHLRAQRAQVLHQVVGEGIVVVDDRDHRSPRSARCTAIHSARPLLMVSSHSARGSESATIPAPTPQWARPLAYTSVRMVMARSRFPW